MTAVMAVSLCRPALPLRPSFAGSRLQSKPAARRRTARPLAHSISARATSKSAYICIDCGYIYDGSEGAFEKLPSSYRCPVCSAPKRRFKPYSGGSSRNDAKSMDARYQKMQKRGGGAAGSDGNNVGLLVGLAAGAAALAGVYLYLSSVYS